METPELLENVEERLRKAVLAAALFGAADDAPRIGRFALLQRIGAGAMGVVYEAFDAQLDRRVAIKLVRNENKVEAHTNRLLREARAMAKLAHPNVVTVYDVGQWEGGLFVAMELVRGGTLQGWLAAQTRGVRETLDMFLAAGRGLVAAHGAGLIHRDFKPANVLVGEDDRPRVADFGLVRLAGEVLLGAEPSSAFVDGFSTATGAVLGTPAYMAPEQLQGARVGAGADQFSFCVALYEALCGVLPFGGGTCEDRLRAIQAGELTPPAPGRRPVRRVLDVLRRGLSAEPHARFPSMQTLLDALIVAERRGKGRWVSMAGGALLCALGAFGKAANNQQPPAASSMQLDAAEQQHDATLLSAARRLSPTDPTLAAVLLAEVEAPQRHREWSTLAQEVLAQPIARFVWNDVRLSPSQHADHVVLLQDLEGSLIARSLDDGRELARRNGAEWGAVYPQGDELLVHTTRGLEIWPLGRTTTTPSWQSDRSGIARVALGATGRDIFALSNDGSVLHWDETRPTTPAVLRVIGDSQDNTRAIVLADAGVVWKSTARDGIEIWPLRGQGSPQRLDFGGNDFTAAHISRTARRIAVGFDDGTIQLWSKGGRTPIEVRGHSSEIRHLLLSDERERLVAWAVDGSTRIWNLQSLPMKQSRETPLMLPRHEATTMTMNADGRMLMTTSPGVPGMTRAWDLSTQDVSVLRTKDGSDACGHSSPDGKWAFTCSIHGSARAWPLDSPSTTLAFGHSAPIWAGKRQGNRLATASQDGTARIWQIGERGELRETAVYSSAPATRVWTAVFSPGGEWLATGSNDGKARVWNTNGSQAPVVFSGHEEWVYSLAFSPDDQSLFTGSKRGCIRRFRIDGGAPAVILCQASVRGQVNEIVLSADGTKGAAALASGHLVVWDNAGAVVSHAPRVIPTAHGEQVQAMVFRPDGRQLVSVGRDRKVRLWDTASGAWIRDIGAHDGAVYHVSMSPDGRQIVTSSADGTARVWPMEGDGAPVILKGHEGWVVWAEFDRAGRRIVTAGYAATARIWDLEQPMVPRVLRGHWNGIRYATFDERGQRVITAAMDGTVRSWDIADEKVERLQRRLREATRACLTTAQRVELIGEDATTAAERAAACSR
ncbi:MAG: protein kinase [Polyangiaceae bacterium]|nr:protein kinase [Polyangiaceae bacterium]